MISEKVIEYRGERVVVQKRTRPGEDGASAIDYSLDGGESWHETIVGAYQAASEAGRLCREVPASEGGADEDTQAFVLALLLELQKLGPGESLKVLRGEGTFSVLREETVLVTRASNVTDIQFKIDEEG